MRYSYFIAQAFDSEGYLILLFRGVVVAVQSLQKIYSSNSILLCWMYLYMRKFKAIDLCSLLLTDMEMRIDYGGPFFIALVNTGMLYYRVIIFNI